MSKLGFMLSANKPASDKVDGQLPEVLVDVIEPHRSAVKHGQSELGPCNHITHGRTMLLAG